MHRLITKFGWLILLLLGSAILPSGSAGAADDHDAFREVRALLDDGRYLESVEASETVLLDAESTHGTGSLHYAEALDLHVEARHHHGMFMDPETLRLAELAVAIKEDRLGPDHPEVAESLTNLGSVLRDRGDYASAEQVYARALEIQETVFGPSDAAKARTLHACGVLKALVFEDDEREDLLERALAIREVALGPEDPRTAETLCQLGASLRNSPEHERGRALAERGLAMARSRLRPDHPLVADCTASVALILAARGEHLEAARLYEQAARIQESAPGTGRYPLVRTLTNRAFSLTPTGELENARSALERAETLALELFGPNHRETAFLYSALANHLRVVGDYANSTATFEKAAGIAENLGRAREGTLAAVWVNRGYLHAQTNEHEKAEEFLGKGLSTAEKVFGPKHRWTMTARMLLGEVLLRRGEWRKAREQITWSLEIRGKVYGSDYAGLNTEFTGLGLVFLEVGDFQASIDHHLQALALRRKHLGPSAPVVAGSHEYLAQARLGAGDLAGAVRDALESERIRRELFLLTAGTLSEREALEFQQRHGQSVSIAVQTTLAGASKDHQAARDTFDAMIRSRAIVLDEMASRHRALAAADDEEMFHVWEELARQRADLAALVVGGPGGGPMETYLGELNAARERKEKLERLLARRSVEFRRQRARRQTGFAEVSAALPPDTVLVAYVRYGRYVLPEPVQRGAETERARSPGRSDPIGTGAADWTKRHIPELVAVILPAGEDHPEFVPLGRARDIVQEVRVWRSEASAKPEGLRPAIRRKERSCRAAGEALRRRVWDPVAERLKGARQIFIVPDGALHLVNFAALPVGEDGYLIEEGPTLHYLSAERDLVRGVGVGRAEASLLALGGPDFDGAAGDVTDLTLAAAHLERPSLAAGDVHRSPRSSCGQFRSMEFEPLPGSVREVERIADLWRSRGEGGETMVVTLTGAAANEAVFKRAAPRHTVLHLATHGFFLDEDCDSESEGEGRDGKHRTAARTTTIEMSPLLRAGLVLAGANRRARSDPEGEDVEDGILTAEEIASLDLSKVNWAVLSGCGTGLGELGVGEGVFGLRRAFEIAGARTLIMSLWPVEDEAARTWMTGLYTGGAEGLPTAEAVRRASLEILEARREARKSTHPFYWGAFVAAGDWR